TAGGRRTAEPCWRASASGCSGRALDLRFQASAGRELRHPPGGDRDPLAGGGVDTVSRAALDNLELSEPGEVHLLTPAQCAADRIQRHVEGLFRLPLAEPGVGADAVNYVALGHSPTSR